MAFNGTKKNLRMKFLTVCICAGPVQNTSYQQNLFHCYQNTKFTLSNEIVKGGAQYSTPI